MNNITCGQLKKYTGGDRVHASDIVELQQWINYYHYKNTGEIRQPIDIPRMTMLDQNNN